MLEGAFALGTKHKGAVKYEKGVDIPCPNIQDPTKFVGAPKSRSIEEALLLYSKIDDFYEIFPALEKVGVDSRSHYYSFYVDDVDVEHQITRLRDEGRIKFQGGAYVAKGNRIY